MFQRRLQYCIWLVLLPSGYVMYDGLLRKQVCCSSWILRCCWVI